MTILLLQLSSCWSLPAFKWCHRLLSSVSLHCFSVSYGVFFFFFFFGELEQAIPTSLNQLETFFLLCPQLEQRIIGLFLVVLEEGAGLTEA